MRRINEWSETPIVCFSCFTVDEMSERIAGSESAVHEMKNTDGVEPSDLDECRGHSDAVRGYHYHVAGAGENMFLGCFHGETVATTGGGGMMPGSCMAGQTSKCCGDGVCDGADVCASSSAATPAAASSALSASAATWTWSTLPASVKRSLSSATA